MLFNIWTEIGHRIDTKRVPYCHDYKKQSRSRYCAISHIVFSSPWYKFIIQ